MNIESKVLERAGMWLTACIPDEGEVPLWDMRKKSAFRNLKEQNIGLRLRTRDCCRAPT